VIRAALLEHEPILLASQSRAPKEASAMPVPIEPHCEPVSDLGVDRTDPDFRLVAESQAEQTMAEAQQAEQDRQQALEQAFQEGYRTGIAEVKQQFAQDLASMDALLKALQKSLADGIGALEPIAVEVAFESVGKIIGEALRSREGVIAIVQQGLRAAREREQVVVHLAPADYEWVTSARSALGQGQLASIELLSDEQVKLGGCLVTGVGGGLDARLETQFLRLQEVLLDASGSRQQVST
jgi:flagellar assembly protein FliH